MERLTDSIDLKELVAKQPAQALATQKRQEKLYDLSLLLQQTMSFYKVEMEATSQALWMEALQSYPVSVVREAIKKHMASPEIHKGFPVCKSFPMQGQVKAYIAADTEHRRITKQIPGCKECDFTGWKAIKTKNGNPGAVRCKCRRQAERLSQ